MDVAFSEVTFSGSTSDRGWKSETLVFHHNVIRNVRELTWLTRKSGKFRRWVVFILKKEKFESESIFWIYDLKIWNDASDFHLQLLRNHEDFCHRKKTLSNCKNFKAWGKIFTSPKHMNEFTDPWSSCQLKLKYLGDFPPARAIFMDEWILCQKL